MSSGWISAHHLLRKIDAVLDLGGLRQELARQISSLYNLHEIPHRASPMDPAYISAFAALAGTAVGGLTSFATSWTTQTGASTGPAACRREGGPSRVVWQVSGRGGKIVYRCPAK